MNYKEHFRKNIQLAWPVMLTQAGQVLVNVADNVMVGALGGEHDNISNPELGKLALGAVSIGNSLFFVIMITGIGFSFAMSPLVAQADARNNLERGSKLLSQGLILNLILGFVLLGILFLAVPFMYDMRQPEAVVDLAIPYLKVVGYSMIPLMIFQSFRQFSEGLSLTRIVAIATIVANLLNVFFNYGFIFGNMGFPRLEVEGAAYGTLISRLLMVLTLVVAMWIHPKSKSYLRLINLRSIHPYIYKKLILLGTPTAFQMFFEVGAFASAAFICGMAGEDDLAAHQIVMNLASTTFMIVTGLAVAATVRVGNQLGLKDYKNLNTAGWSAIGMSAAFMLMCGVAFILFRNILPELYLENQEVLNIAASLMIVAAFFQLSDGIQVTALGALRGMQDVQVPTLITFVAYFAIALPLGYYLTVPRGMGALGMWIGLGLGLTVSAILLLIRFRRQSNLIQAKIKVNSLNIPE
ncbi:MATE family efflux transporter [Flavobacteriaceae bacterium Ap0902]|nr:MATE family efflux transporter [Flavobacteriaceae bacterium Ap0902]